MQRKFDKFLQDLMNMEGPCSDKHGSFLVAVSGGVDSMCLASLFLHSGVEFAVAHCNFHLRGEESDADEALVRDWCKLHDVQCFVSDFDTERVAVERGVSIEMAARDLRYAWFASLCSEYGYGALAVAHNANDNAETLILNMLRGCGMRGLCGMKALGNIPVAGSQVPLLRPLLGVSRAEIEAYASSQGLVWHTDRTNADVAYRRNRIRNNVFPEFAAINPSFLETFSDNMALFAEGAAIAESYLSENVGKVVSICEDGATVDVPALKTCSHWKYLLFRILEQYGFASGDVASLCRLLESGGTFSGKTFRSAGYEAVTASGRIVVRPVVRDSSDREGGEGFEGGECREGIEVGGVGSYDVGGRVLTVEVLHRSEIESLKTPAGVILADASKLSFPFVVRCWRAGDWMVPFGMRGRRKLSDMFTDMKYSLPDKKKALVAVPQGLDPSHVAALIGVRIDDSFKVSPDTGNVVRIICH